MFGLLAVLFLNRKCCFERIGDLFAGLVPHGGNDFVPHLFIDGAVVHGFAELPQFSRYGESAFAVLIAFDINVNIRFYAQKRADEREGGVVFAEILVIRGAIFDGGNQSVAELVAFGRGFSGGDQIGQVRADFERRGERCIHDGQTSRGRSFFMEYPFPVHFKGVGKRNQ